MKAAIFSPKNVHIRLPQDFFDFIKIDDYVYDDEWDNPNPVYSICENLPCTCQKEIIAELGSMLGV